MSLLSPPSLYLCLVYVTALKRKLAKHNTSHVLYWHTLYPNIEAKLSIAKQRYPSRIQSRALIFYPVVQFSSEQISISSPISTAVDRRRDKWLHSLQFKSYHFKIQQDYRRKLLILTCMTLSQSRPSLKNSTTPVKRCLCAFQSSKKNR